MRGPSEPNGGGEEPSGGRPPRFRGIWAWVLAFGLVLVVGYALMQAFQETPEISTHELHEIMTEKRDAIDHIFIKGNVVHGTLREGAYENMYPREFTVHLPARSVDDYYARLREAFGSRFVRNPEKDDRASYVPEDPFFWQTLLAMAPWLLILVVLWFIVSRQMRSASGPGGVLSFGRSRAKLAKKEHVKITFDDVAGIEEAKEEVKEIIEFLKNPQRFQVLGGRIPRGVMLVGPPGTGKTLLAKAIAGEAEVPFFSISGSDFVEMFVGVGASRVRDLFRQAKESSPCIIFLDEIDAVGRRRGMGYTGGHDEREQTLNAILVEMDGFDTNEQVIVIGSTNRPDVLDPALRRPGRFDREINLHLPDLKEREAILKVHAREIRIGEEVDLGLLARGTPGFSGADLAAIINESAIRATLLEKTAVDQSDLEEARDKVRWGRAKRSRALDEEDRELSAHHEAGHVLMTLLLEPDVEPLHKVSIIPRGMSLGATMFLPEKDRYTVKRKQCLGQMKVAFSGRLTEEIFFGDISSGAADDIRQATTLARRMVCDWGMSERLGPIRYAPEEASTPWGSEVFGNRDHSDATARQIDEEVQDLIHTNYDQAKFLLQQNREALERIAQALLKRESLTAQEVRDEISDLELHKEVPPDVGGAVDGSEEA
jgi:cell division protease FtsH